MTKEEFISKLKEDKFFENPEEQVNYRLPVVQYYITNYSNIVFHSDKGTFDSKNINLVRSNTAEEFRLINYAFNAIKDLVLYNRKTLLQY